ncbi:hypothetical protein [Algihabitans albus]|uniref:hypothetical protein n=1 Tax=Algihabitans albus TaxID=2164067 RepID=UPI000E5CEA25|nr:hypothetical protein [Algihabitans albus]
MRPVIIGGLVAAAVIAAFVVGLLVAEEDKGPLERAGERIDEAVEGAAEELERGAEGLQRQ